VPQPGQWTVTGENTVWQGDYLSCGVARLVTPAGEELNWDVIRGLAEDVAALVIARGGQVLLVWRHRPVVHHWGWELPGGARLRGEGAVEAAARISRAQTGWEVLEPRPVWAGWRAPAHCDQRVHLCAARAGAKVAEADGEVVADLGWFQPDQVADLLRRGDHVGDPLTFAALSWFVAQSDEGRP
jgi:ADP-ribose pyrophosphatase YjhB (NUDIX family)